MEEQKPLADAEAVTAHLRRVWLGRAVGLVYDGWTHHVRVHTSLGERNGRDEVVADTVQNLAAFPDLRFRGEETVAAEGRGLYVSHLAVRDAHNTGYSVYGPPTGRRVHYLAATDLLVRDGRVAEMWRVHDGLGLTRQLGLSDDEAVAVAAAQLPGASPLWGRGALESRGQEAPEPLPEPSPDEGQGPEAFVAWVWHEVWNRRRFDRIAEVYAPGYRFRGPSGVRSRTREAYTSFVLGLLAAFPDAVMGLEHLCHNGHTVGVRWRFLGTHDGPGRYGAPTGRRVNVFGITHLHLQNGQLLGECTVFDELALLAQLRPQESVQTTPTAPPDAQPILNEE